MITLTKTSSFNHVYTLTGSNNYSKKLTIVIAVATFVVDCEHCDTCDHTIHLYSCLLQPKPTCTSFRTLMACKLLCIFVHPLSGQKLGQGLICCVIVFFSSFLYRYQVHCDRRRKTRINPNLKEIRNILGHRVSSWSRTSINNLNRDIINQQTQLQLRARPYNIKGSYQLTKLASERPHFIVAIQ